MPDVDDIIELFNGHGDSLYGGEAITQLEHALQAASLAEQERCDDELITAALLHDVGHLLHDLPVDAPDSGVDDHHEKSAANYLRHLFSPRVIELIRLHVEAKRYLRAADACYLASLSQPSIVSLGLQGGPMTPHEAAEFEKHPSATDAIRLRRWDDAAKVPQLSTPTFLHFANYARRVAWEADPE